MIEEHLQLQFVEIPPSCYRALIHTAGILTEYSHVRHLMVAWESEVQLLPRETPINNFPEARRVRRPRRGFIAGPHLTLSLERGATKDGVQQARRRRA